MSVKPLVCIKKENPENYWGEGGIGDLVKDVINKGNMFILSVKITLSIYMDLIFKNYIKKVTEYSSLFTFEKTKLFHRDNFKNH